jgi:hypothetical protein
MAPRAPSSRATSLPVELVVRESSRAVEATPAAKPRRQAAAARR